MSIVCTFFPTFYSTNSHALSATFHATHESHSYSHNRNAFIATIISPVGSAHLSTLGIPFLTAFYETHEPNLNPYRPSNTKTHHCRTVVYR
jgi:hypothetical protein